MVEVTEPIRMPHCSHAGGRADGGEPGAGLPASLVAGAACDAIEFICQVLDTSR